MVHNSPTAVAKYFTTPTEHQSINTHVLIDNISRGLHIYSAKLKYFYKVQIFNTTNVYNGSHHNYEMTNNLITVSNVLFVCHKILEYKAKPPEQRPLDQSLMCLITEHSLNHQPSTQLQRCIPQNVLPTQKPAFDLKHIPPDTPKYTISFNNGLQVQHKALNASHDIHILLILSEVIYGFNVTELSRTTTNIINYACCIPQCRLHFDLVRFIMPKNLSAITKTCEFMRAGLRYALLTYKQATFFQKHAKSTINQNKQWIRSLSTRLSILGLFGSNFT